MLFKYGYTNSSYDNIPKYKLGIESLIDENLEDIEFNETYAALESCAIDTFMLEKEAVGMEVAVAATSTASSSDKKAWYKKFYEWIKSLGSRISDFFVSAYKWVRRKLFGEPDSPAKVKEVVKETIDVIEETAAEVKDEVKVEENSNDSVVKAGPKPIENPGAQTTKRPHSVESIKELAKKNIEKHPTISKLPAVRKVQIVKSVVDAITGKKTTVNFWVFTDEVTKRLNFRNSTNVYRGAMNDNSVHSGLFNVVMAPAYALKSLMEVFYGITNNKEIPDIDNGSLEPLVEMLTELDKDVKSINRAAIMKEISYNFTLNENYKISREELQKFYKTYGETVKFAGAVNKFMAESEDALKRVREKTKALKESDFESYVKDGKDPKVILKNFQTSGRLIASISKTLFKYIKSDIKVRSGVTQTNYNNLDVEPLKD
jgi:hypothetical protein